jgi:hypothetical protein
MARGRGCGEEVEGGSENPGRVRWASVSGSRSLCIGCSGWFCSSTVRRGNVGVLCEDGHAVKVLGALGLDEGQFGGIDGVSRPVYHDLLR